MAIKKCEICGKEFIDYGRGKYCNGPHYSTCVVCGKEFEYEVRHKKPLTCSNNCRIVLANKNMHYKAKLCKECGKEFIPLSGNQKFCKHCKLHL